MSSVERQILEFLGKSRRTKRTLNRQFLRVNVAHTLQKMRSSAKMTQRQLAERAGMSQPEVSRLECAGGARAPDLNTLVRFAQVCGYELKLVAARKGTGKREKPLTTQLQPPSLK